MIEPGRYASHLSGCTFLGPDEHCDCGYEEFVARVEGADAVLRQARTAIRLTREYVGEELLPALPGWSHHDATLAIDALLGDTEADEWQHTSTGPHNAEASTVSFGGASEVIGRRIENVKGGLQLVFTPNAPTIDGRRQDRIIVVLEIGESKATLEGVVRERTDADEYIIAVTGGTVVVQPVTSEADET